LGLVNSGPKAASGGGGAVYGHEQCVPNKHPDAFSHKMHKRLYTHGQTR
jgi:hypothetical protein